MRLPINERGASRPSDDGLTRRGFLGLGAAAMAAALFPAAAAAAPRPSKQPGGPSKTPLEDPYAGAIPLDFPLAGGTYRKPLRDNWHDNREGPAYDWSHQNSATQRAHDGIDIFPRFAGTLPLVHAPCAARVVQINIDGSRATDGTTDGTLAPPEDYPQGRDPQVNIYGNYLWLEGTTGASAGYYFFFCHLQADETLRVLAQRLITKPVAEPLVVDARQPVGRMGDSGNAPGDPQLHVELYLPRTAAFPDGEKFSCAKCPPLSPKRGAANPFPSLAQATTW